MTSITYDNCEVVPMRESVDASALIPTAAAAPLRTDAADDFRHRLVLALDVDDAVAARRLALQLRPWFGVVKVGLELFCAAGPDIVSLMLDDGYHVFLDLKLADIPTTVGRATRVLGSLGVSYLTVHAAMGLDSLRAGVEGLADGAAKAGLEVPAILAVTILTSDRNAGPQVLGERIGVALAAGCAGLVCGPQDVAEAKRLAPRLLAAVPGTRPPGVPADDHARTTTGVEAFAAGADLLIIGRPVTAQADPPAAAAALVAGLAVTG
jgi:orotidine-5'-phosphate decarboxylase